MSLNAWLCKYFDIGNKGYVSLGGFVSVILMVGVLTSIVIAILYFLCRGIIFFLNFATRGVPPQDDIGQIGSFLVAIVIVLFVVALVDYSFKIKIAKCPLKK